MKKPESLTVNGRRYSLRTLARMPDKRFLKLVDDVLNAPFPDVNEVITLKELCK